METPVKNSYTQVNLTKLQEVTHSDCVGVAIETVEDGERTILWSDMIGSLNERYKHIRLHPGRGIAGIVYKTARPWIVTDVDTVIPKREQYRYPILISEKIKSFFALPVIVDSQVNEVIIIGYRGHQPMDKDVLYRYVRHVQEVTDLQFGGVF